MRRHGHAETRDPVRMINQFSEEKANQSEAQEEDRSWRSPEVQRFRSTAGCSEDVPFETASTRTGSWQTGRSCGLRQTGRLSAIRCSPPLPVSLHVGRSIVALLGGVGSSLACASALLSTRSGPAAETAVRLSTEGGLETTPSAASSCAAVRRCRLSCVWTPQWPARGTFASENNRIEFKAILADASLAGIDRSSVLDHGQQQQPSMEPAVRCESHAARRGPSVQCTDWRCSRPPLDGWLWKRDRRRAHRTSNMHSWG